MGYVYFFKHKGMDAIKIGHTKGNDTELRFTAFNTYSPRGAENLGQIEVYDPAALEKQIHNDYKDRRLSGEFFDIDKDELSWIIEHYSNSYQNNFYILKIKLGFVTIYALDRKNIIPEIMRHYSQGKIYEIDIIMVNSSQNELDALENISKGMTPIKDGLWYEKNND